MSEEPSPAVPQSFDYARHLLVAVEESLFAQFGAGFGKRISCGGFSGRKGLSMRTGPQFFSEDIGQPQMKLWSRGHDRRTWTTGCGSLFDGHSHLQRNQGVQDENGA